ncbi:putative membrane protein, partial [Bacteroides fragilis str. S23 R14]
YFIHYFQKYRVLLKFFENYGVFPLLLFLFLDSTYILIILYFLSFCIFYPICIACF